VRTIVTSAKRMSKTLRVAVIECPAAEIHNRVGPWLRTREGVASATVSLVVLSTLSGGLGAPLLTGLLGAAFAIILVSVVARFWESRTTPRASFSPMQDLVDGCVELQADPSAGFWRDRRGFLWGPRIWFAGTGCPPRQIRPDTYLRLRARREQGDDPVFVARARRRQWWWWQDVFYWESGDCEPEDAAALLLMLERDDAQGLEWELDARLAEPIPEIVKRVVDKRDRGRCLACGSDELIQHNRVVPWPMGGRNEPQNIRLLCAGCNRRERVLNPARAFRA
jgi:hypothetical protein